MAPEQTVSLAQESILFSARLSPGVPGLVNRVTPTEAGWDLLEVGLRRLAPGETWSAEAGDHEVALVLLGGRCDVASNHGNWEGVGGRADVFSGLPWAIYLPRGTSFTLQALEEGVEVACCRVPTDQDHEPVLVRPEDCPVEVRGGGHATRQINDILPPGFPCHRIVACEVYTPGGNWSSYPPHKHDTHRVGDDGRLEEADLEEVYLYKLRNPRGYALQRVYTDDRSLDATVAAHDGDLVLVPEGYHPVSAPVGYDCYYLNFLAGSAQSLAASDDPDHAWLKDGWPPPDPRLPMVGPGSR